MGAGKFLKLLKGKKGKCKVGSRKRKSKRKNNKANRRKSNKNTRSNTRNKRQRRNNSNVRKTQNKRKNNKCNSKCGDPVDAVTGEVVVEENDFSVVGRLGIYWDRYYSSQNSHIGVCGFGWETPADARLEICEDGTVLFYDGTDAPLCFDNLPDEDEDVLEPVEGSKFSIDQNYYTVQLKDNLIYYFPAENKSPKEIKVEYLKDLCGNTIQYKWDNNGLKEIYESSGKKIDVRSKNGLIKEMYLVHPYSDPYLLARYEYDKDGTMTAACDILGASYKFQYKNKLMVKRTYKEGLSFHYEYDKYDENGRCIHSWGDNGLFDYRFDYNDQDKVTKVTDSLGGITCFKYDELYMVYEEIDALGGVTAYEYDHANRTSAVIDPDGNRTEYVYDNSGNMIKLLLPDGNSLVTEFDEENNPVNITKPNGASWLQEWNDKGLLVEQKSPLGARHYYNYDEYGQLIEYIDPMAASTKFEYDQNGNVNKYTDSLGNFTKITYDNLGNIAARVDALGQKTTYQYDLKGRLIKTILPGGAYVIFSYDKEDNLITYKDEKGEETRLEYCNINQVRRRIQPDGGVVEFHYDSEAELIGVTNQRGEKYELKRDGLGRIVCEVDYWGQERKYSYTGSGCIKESLDPLGRILEYKTDSFGRVIEKLIPNIRSDGQFQVEKYQYDADGNIVNCENNHIKVERDYDVEGRLIEERQGSFCVISNLYDLKGNRISRTTLIDCDGQQRTQTVNYNYDSQGQAISIEIPGHELFVFKRNEFGQITDEILGSNLKRRFEYNQEGYLTKQKVLKSEGQLFIQEYTYDSAGNTIARNDSEYGNDKFTYDPVGRIVSHVNPVGKVEKYFHDKAGDILSTKVVDNGSDLDGWSRLGKYEGNLYRFNKDGNLVERTGSNLKQQFVWDENQRLVESISNGIKTLYVYDPFGRRISKTTGDTATYFYWDEDTFLGDVILEQSESKQREWIFYPDSFEPLALLQDSKIFIYHNDPNGVPIRILEPDGKVVWAAKYDILGKVINLPVCEIDNPLRMQGQYFDSETGLYYNRYRYYDPEIKSFISQDPLGLDAGENIYDYAPNILMWIDPLGLAKTCRNISVKHKTRKEAKEAGAHSHHGKPRPTPKKSDKKKREEYKEAQKYKKPERHPKSAHTENHFHDSDKTRKKERKGINVHHTW